MATFQDVFCCRRDDRKADVESKVCSCHFLNSVPSSLPTIFTRNENIDKQFRYTAPESYNRKRRRPLTELTNSETAVEPTPAKTYEFRTSFHEAEKYFLNQEIDRLKEEVRRLRLQNFGFFSIGDNDKKCLYYTGVHIEVFHLIVKLCASTDVECYDGIRVEKISSEDQIFLTFIKLRLNLAYVDLGWRFGISATTAFRIVNTFIPVLHKVLFQSLMEEMPSRRKNKLCLPLSFVSFTSCRMITDCTEMKCDVPKQMDHQKLTSTIFSS